MNKSTEEKNRKTRILLVTSAYTGAGHKSISDALMEHFSRMADLEVMVIDGFELAGRFGIWGAKTYGSMIRHFTGFYNLCWRISMAVPPTMKWADPLCHKRFEQHIRQFQPDLVLSVHSMANVLLSRMLEKAGFDIPLAVLQADPVSIHSTWCNPNAYMTICLTQDGYESCLSQGLKPERLKIMDFPIRERFEKVAMENRREDFNRHQPLNCLLMSGGEGSDQLKAYAREVLGKSDFDLTIVCGRNEKLHEKLEKELAEPYGRRVRICGFVEEMEKLLLDSDLMICRGSPNTLYEAVMMNIPLIITGPLLEQERGNRQLIRQYDLGLICQRPKELGGLINELLADDAALWRRIAQSQRRYRRFGSAQRLAEYLAALADSVKKIK